MYSGVATSPGGMRGFNGQDALSPTTAMDDLVNKCERISAMTGELCAKLESVSERVLGPVPEGPGGPPTAPPPSGSLGRVISRLDDLERLVEACHRRADRLQQI